MPIKVVDAAQARPRLKVRGAISSNGDYSAVIAQLPQVVQQGKSIEVELDLNAFPDVKGEKKRIPFLFCASLRRYFANNGIACECYQSGPTIVTIKKAKQVPRKPVQKR